MEQEILQIAAQAGIATHYIDSTGQQQAVSLTTLHQLLAAMKADVLPANRRPLPISKIVHQGERGQLPVMGQGEYHWLLQCEAGEQQRGVIHGPVALILPLLPLGYHQLTLSQGQQCWQCQVVVTPIACYQAEALLQGQKLWGACVQLYSLRSECNWGIGDFGDLRRLIIEIAQRGGAFVGLNPIHALYPAAPDYASPYSPSSRRWLNVLYIDVNAVDDFQHSHAAQQWWQQPATQQALAQARQSHWVDYTAVTQLKLTALRLAFTQFNARDRRDDQQHAFEHFILEGGSSLYQQALFDALHGQFAADEQDMKGWQSWPEAYQRVDSPEVMAFCQHAAQQIRFYQWLQWLAEGQLAACFALCRKKNMPIGLYRDLAVGVAQGEPRSAACKANTPLLGYRSGPCKML